MLCLEVAVHHEALHKQVVTNTKYWQLLRAIPIDTPIFVVTPVFWDVDSRLCAQSTEYCHQTRFWVFIFTISKTKLLSDNQSSPKSADS